MKIKNILFGATILLAGLSFTGCYENFNMPVASTTYDDGFFIEQGYELKTVADIKLLFNNAGTGGLETLNPTVPTMDYAGEYQKYLTRDGGDPQNSALYSCFYRITEPYYIKCKVISNDAGGNFFRSLFVQDATGGIEVKVGGSSMFSTYSIGSTVFVLCEGLVLGNYRSMLSLGLAPDGATPEDLQSNSDLNPSEDRSDNGTPYPNRFIDLTEMIEWHVKPGAHTSLEPSDILVVTEDQPISDADLYNWCGRLVRFAKLTSVWEVDDSTSPPSGYPEVFYKLEFNTYTSFNFPDMIEKWRAFRAGETSTEPTFEYSGGASNPNNGKTYIYPEPENLHLSDRDPSFEKPTWGFKEYANEFGEEDRIEQDNYASAKFTHAGYSGDAELLVRTSGYSRFALRPITPDGGTAQVTGIMSRYTSGTGGYPAFQIAVNDIFDIVEPAPVSAK